MLRSSSITRGSSARRDRVGARARARGRTRRRRRARARGCRGPARRPARSARPPRPALSSSSQAGFRAAITPLTVIGRMSPTSVSASVWPMSLASTPCDEPLVDRGRGLRAARQRLAVRAPHEPEARVADAVLALARAALLVVVEVAGGRVRAPADVDADVRGGLALRSRVRTTSSGPWTSRSAATAKTSSAWKLPGWVATIIATPRYPRSSSGSASAPKRAIWPAGSGPTGIRTIAAAPARARRSTAAAHSAAVPATASPSSSPARSSSPG